VLENARQITGRLMKARGLNPDNRVVEIASNDGYLLKNYQQKGVPVLGIEPAQNIARRAEAKGIRTISDFFDLSLAQRLRDDGMSADVIHANNVVAHVADLKGVVEGIGILLSPDGVAVIENHYVKDLIDHVEFDSIYHEHLCYYSVTSFNNLFHQFNIVMVDAERIPIHGGSLRVFFQRADGPQTWGRAGRNRVERLLKEEQAWGVGQFSFYRDFGNKVACLRQELLALLRRLKSEGRRIAVYGASAKSTTLLNYFGIGSEILDFVADRSTVKQGYYTPGTHLQIMAPDKLLEVQPDYVLLLSWNFVDEVLSQQAEYRKRGGRFIVPIPELRVI
jgi:SAM-dependent methyltransferase